MAIDTNKPEPLEIGGRFYYTLSSYAPVSVEIKTLRTTDADVNFALARICLQNGIQQEDLTDEMIKEHMKLDSIEAAKKALRAQLEQANAAHAEQDKQVKCADELAKRLEQRIPDTEVARFKQLIEDSIAHDAVHMQMDAEQFKLLSGITPDSLEEMARLSATHEAAFNAYADKKKLEVTEDELPEILGAQSEQIKTIVEEAKKNNKLEQLLSDLRPRKAAQEISAEAKVTFQLETEAEAKERATHYPEFLKMMKDQLEKADKAHERNHKNGGCCGGHGHSEKECCGGRAHKHEHEKHNKNCKCKDKEAN